MTRDCLAVSVATPGLLRSGRRQPVAVAIDDFQWLDGVSRECVPCAACRAPGAVAFALAVREAEGADPTAEELLALMPGRPGHKNSLQVLSCAAADCDLSMRPRWNRCRTSRLCQGARAGAKTTDPADLP